MLVEATHEMAAVDGGSGGVGCPTEANDADWVCRRYTKITVEQAARLGVAERPYAPGWFVGPSRGDGFDRRDPDVCQIVSGELVFMAIAIRSRGTNW